MNVRWFDKEINENLWKRADQEIDIQIEKRKWVWTYFALQKPINSITRRALKWNPQGKRNRGRLRNTWLRDPIFFYIMCNLSIV